jgi:hypothetical protein
VAQEKTYNFPVFGTQGGGLVREIKTTEGYKYIFVEKPDCPGLDVGDFMPEQWGIIAANQQALDAIDEEQFGDDHLFDQAMAEYLHHGPNARQL